MHNANMSPEKPQAAITIDDIEQNDKTNPGKNLKK